MKHRFFENTEILLYYDAAKEKWYIKNKTNNIDYDLSLSENLSSFLQIFYEDPSSFFSELSKKVEKEGINEKVIEALPFKESVIFCIENNMLFWLELSLKWLEYMKIDEELEKSIKTIINNPKYPQSIRHQIRKLVNSK